jgi:hypothetical protein
MFTCKEPILVFGAGQGAARAVRCLRHRCRVVAFVDNDARRHGGRFMGRPIVSPAMIASQPAHRIFVASMHADEIYRQLTVDLAVEPGRIEVVRRSILEGAYEVSPRTFVVAAGIAMLAVGGVTGVIYMLLAILD